MTTVFLNGKLLSAADARVSAFDAGLQHGVGLFETMTAEREGGRVIVARLEEHIERLADSAREVGLSDSLRASALADAVVKTVEESGLERTRVRLTVTGGDLNMLAGRAGDPTILIVAQPATVYPPEMFERGVMASIADFKANPLDPMAGHKTLNYWGRLRELQMAAAKGAGEALVFQVTNHLAGGCVSNCFLVKDGTLITPIARGEEKGIPSPVLPGITRGWVIDWANRRSMRVEKRMVTISDVLGADECFLTNSSWGVLPVVRVEKQEIGDGEVGDVARELVESWE